MLRSNLPSHGFSVDNSDTFLGSYLRCDGTNLVFSSFLLGELKSTKSYEKWARKISETKPPTSPLKKRVKWVLSSCLLLWWWYPKFYISQLSHCIKAYLVPGILYRSNKESETDLYAVISQRRNERKEQFDSMFSSLISKYGGGNASEPTEEEFEAAQKKLESRKSSKKSKRK